MRVLILEDDVDLAAQVATVLRNEHYTVDVCHDGQEGYDRGIEKTFDAVILDPGLPTMDGFSVLRRWRQQGLTMPVIVISGSRKEVTDMKEGVRAGATNYLTKPVDLDLLLDWMRGVVNRAAPVAEKPVIERGGIRVDTQTLEVWNDNAPVKVTPTEYRILHHLMTHSDRAVPAEELVPGNADGDVDRSANEVSVFIKRLRDKLGKEAIETVFGRGYRMAGGKGAP